MATSMHRTVSARLTFAIIIAPLVFCWFTLRQGYSGTARLVSIGYALLMVVITMLVLMTFVVFGMSVASEIRRTAVTAGAGAPRVEVSASDLMAAYAADPNEAKAEYAGRNIVVHGEVALATRGHLPQIKFLGGGTGPTRTLGLDAMLRQDQDPSRLPTAGEQETLVCSTIMTMHPIPGGPAIPVLANCTYGDGDGTRTPSYSYTT